MPWWTARAASMSRSAAARWCPALVMIPYRGKNKPQSQKDANKAHAKLRSPGERANAQLKTLADPPQAPLLPLARLPARQGHPRIADPRGKRRMKELNAGLMDDTAYDSAEVAPAPLSMLTMWASGGATNMSSMPHGTARRYSRR